MTTNNSIRIERRSEVIKRTGLPQTTLQDRMASGLFPRPIPLGGRAVGWPAYEVDAVIAAMIAGYDISHLRRLVSELTENRKARP